MAHRTLTLRSVKETDLSTRVDLRFVSVHRIDLPTEMKTVTLLVDTVAGPAPHELALDGIVPGNQWGPFPNGRRFILRGTDYEGSIVAGGGAMHEDTREWNDPAWWDIDPRER